ncbi:ATP synthase F0 subunit B [Nocardiopsis sp. JB363]|uniref:ATP synthase F0 subunit B n=1 Tax=Nocardiopsis sp. JB363 TaxID=1434837 RepID=UPI00097B5100|nr:ATP synthase F0 subunit B [Nocardiopsis sp. JB363]SIO84644.1 Phage protein [Nocardiopsis sp. JB363]
MTLPTLRGTDTRRQEPIDPVRVLAGVLAAGSVIFTGWKIWDLIAGPGAGLLMHGVGVASGLAVESAWLMLLALAYQQATRTGQVSRWVTIAGWVLAIGAAGILAAHGVQSTSWVMALLGVLPLMAKTAWHGLTHIRALETQERVKVADQDREQAERVEAEREKEAARIEAQHAERERALSTGLTPEQEEELAQIRRQAAYARAKATAESELTTAEADADRERQQAEAESERIRRQAESQLRQEAVQNKTEEELAVLEANARLVKRRQEVEVELELTRPYALPSGTGARVPDDASMLNPGGPGTPGSFVASGAGFGGAMVATSATAAHMGGSDQQMPQVPGAVVHHSSAEAEVNRARVAQVFKVLEQATGEAPSIAAVARGAGVSDRAAGRHLRAAGLID